MSSGGKRRDALDSTGSDGGAGKTKKRLDHILVKRGFFDTRSQAAASVLAGWVRVDGREAAKAGSLYYPDADIELKEERRFVSRGGLKLQRAFEVFDLDVSGRLALDGGASSGGFSDCLLKHGATRVIAVDVGYGQLDWGLRQDRRVQVMERTNIRYIKPEDLSGRPSIAVLDLSFISLKKVIPAVIECLQPGYEIIALVKPQFEAGRGKVGKGGVVRDLTIHRQVLEGIWGFAEEAGCRVSGLVDSGTRGPKGNVEYLLYLVDGGGGNDVALDREAVIEDLLRKVEGIINPA